MASGADSMAIMSSFPNAVIVACGSLSPVTFMHINLLDCARSEAVKRGYNVLYGLLSPVHGSYGKPGLASAPHRLAMARLAVQGSWIEASSWEVDRQCYSASWQVVEWVHQDYVSRGYSGRPVVLFACGADLFEAMTDHRRWPVANVHRLLDRAILAVAKRPGSDVNAVLSAPVFDDRWDRIVFVSEALSDISSSTLRSRVRRHQSIDRLTTASVVEYIRMHKLFL